MAKLVFVVALLVAYMAAPAASGTSTRWTTETSRRTESTTNWRTESTTTRRTESTTTSSGWIPERNTTNELTNSTDISTTDEEKIKNYVRTAKSICHQCQIEAQYVLTKSNKSDICQAVDVYSVCTSRICIDIDAVDSFNTQAQSYCYSTNMLTTDEEKMKNYVQAAKSICHKCQSEAQYVLTRSNKSDICHAVDVYSVCTSLSCFLTIDTVDSFNIQAHSYCVNTPGYNPRIHTVEADVKRFMLQAKYVCPQCQSEADFVQTRSNIADICNAADLYETCSLVNCTGFELVHELYTSARDTCPPSTSPSSWTAPSTSPSSWTAPSTSPSSWTDSSSTGTTTNRSTSYNPRTDSSTTWPTTDEGRIKHYIQLAKSTCSKCQTDADYALTRSYKIDICNAVDQYGSCSLVYCYGSENVNSLYVQAQDMCDTKTYSYAGSGVIRASMFAALATSAVTIFFTLVIL